VPAFVDHYGPWAIVTGAAQGVGLAFADALLERGCSVVLVDRQPEVHDVARARGASARSVVSDLTDPSWLGALAQEVDGLEVGLAVANAAVAYVGPFLEQPAASRAGTIAVNCSATVELAAWALPPMVARGRGGFIVTSSGSALAGTAAVASYSATKAFGLNLAEAVGWELRDTGVHCLAVVAPTMDTPGWRSHPVDEEAMLQPAVDPRVVVDGALDHLPDGGCWYADPALEVVAGIERRQRVDLLSKATVALYPDEMGTT
jgi:short-subunit dehydrogenase